MIIIIIKDKKNLRIRKWKLKECKFNGLLDTQVQVVAIF